MRTLFYLPPESSPLTMKEKQGYFAKIWVPCAYWWGVFHL